jgi:hypothetical protein
VDSFGDITFQMSLSECTQIAEMLLSQKPKIKLLEPLIALQVIEDCRGKKIRVLGIDGLKVTPSSTQPFSEHSVDYSDKKEAWDDAIAFVKSRADLGLLFEVVGNDESYLGVSTPTSRSPKISYFQESDGWLLYSLTKDFHSLGSIISAGDHFNHSVFTYEELNGGLQRLIQNGYVEEMKRSFRLTKEGKSLKRKVYFPLGLFESSVVTMTRLCNVISSMKLDIEVDYSTNAVSLLEYQTEFDRHVSR